jgi:hypothetical protein
MVRKAIVILALAFATSASAQNTTTNCRKDYFGNVTCDTTERPGINWGLLGQQQNQGQVLQSGANAVPNYAEQQLRLRELQLRERELKLREQAAREAPTQSPPVAIPPPVSLQQKYVMNGDQQRYLDTVLLYCGTGAPISNLPANTQAMTGAICYAYDQGRIAEITGTKR